VVDNVHFYNCKFTFVNLEQYFLLFETETKIQKKFSIAAFGHRWSNATCLALDFGLLFRDPARDSYGESVGDSGIVRFP